MLGALLYPLVIVLWAVIRVLSGLSLRPTDVDLAFVGPFAVASVCCVAAAWGAWLVFTGETHDARACACGGDLGDLGAPP